MNVIQARLGQPVSIDNKTPTQCLNAKDFKSLIYKDGILFIEAASSWAIPAANIAVMLTEPMEPKKK
jgi:hypothetical protein